MQRVVVIHSASAWDSVKRDEFLLTDALTAQTLCRTFIIRVSPAALLDSLKFATQMTQNDRSGQLLVLADFSNADADDAVMALFAE